MLPDQVIKCKIKVKEYNNKFFREQIEAKKVLIEKLQEDCERLEGKIQVNLDEIDKLKNNNHERT
jgi:hypothetical protein